jgi:phosphoribosylaminoimidazole carboxylase PurE protein
MKVGILMGSKSDLPVLKHTGNILEQLHIEYEMKVLSAHRTPHETTQWAERAYHRGIEVIICGAGMAAHLAGAVAAHTIIPVIGVPIAATMMGVDALLSTVQMPPGIPVATVGIGVAGAKNAAWLAAGILALNDHNIKVNIEKSRKKMRQKILQEVI